MPLPKSEWIWFNGQFMPWDDARVHVTTHALHYGSSVFEGIRAYPNPAGTAILGLDAHIQRMYESCKVLRLEVPLGPDQLKEAICSTVARNRHSSCYIRPLIFRGSDTFSLDARSCPTEVAIITFEWGRYLGEEAVEQGVDVMVSSWRRMAPGTFPAMAKVGGNYVNSQLIAMEASDNGYVEGIALDISRAS
jgi:branched-chain amino acid aminotransferase